MLEFQVTVYEVVYSGIISTPFDCTSYRLDRSRHESIGVCDATRVSSTLIFGTTHF